MQANNTKVDKAVNELKEHNLIAKQGTAQHLIEVCDDHNYFKNTKPIKSEDYIQ